MNSNAAKERDLEIRWEAGTAPMACPYKVDEDSKAFLEVYGKKATEEEKKKVKPNRPNKHSGYADTGEIVANDNGRLFKVRICLENL